MPGLRDIIDEQDVVRQELGTAGWQGVPGIFDEILVYGDPAIGASRRRDPDLPIGPPI